MNRRIHLGKAQSAIGHSDVGLTLRVYSHAKPSIHRDAAERLEELCEQSDSDANFSKAYRA